MARTIAIIGAPSSAGAYAPGQEKAPAVFRKHGLRESLEQSGMSVRDAGDVTSFRWRPDLSRPKAMNLGAVQRTAASVAKQVAAAMEANETVLVLGGDCTIELGTVAGAQQDGASVGLVYIDFDVDLNPPEQSDGALDWTVAAHLLNLPGTAPELAGLAGRTPMLQPDEIFFLGANETEITPYEKKVMDKLKLNCVPLAETRKNPEKAALQVLQWVRRFDRMLIHIDTDVLSYTQFPISENVRRSDGLTLDELSRILSVLCKAPNWQVLTITEANPEHVPDESKGFHQLIKALSRAMAD
jgi:arginase